MFSVGHIFLISIFVFVCCGILLTIENHRGKRVVFGGLRNFLDRVISAVVQFLSHWLKYLGRYIIKLSWYYSLHKLLRLTLILLVKIYDNLESVFIDNRKRAKVIKTEKSNLNKNAHLRLVANHKKEVSLTGKEREELLKRKLERD